MPLPTACARAYHERTYAIEAIRTSPSRPVAIIVAPVFLGLGMFGGLMAGGLAGYLVCAVVRSPTLTPETAVVAGTPS